MTRIPAWIAWVFSHNRDPEAMSQKNICAHYLLRHGNWESNHQPFLAWALLLQSRTDQFAFSFGWKTVNNQSLESVAAYGALPLQYHQWLSLCPFFHHLDRTINWMGAAAACISQNNRKYTGACESAIFFVMTRSGTKPMKRQFGDLAQTSGATCTASCAGCLHATGKAQERRVEELSAGLRVPVLYTPLWSSPGSTAWLGNVNISQWPSGSLSVKWAN